MAFALGAVGAIVSGISAMSAARYQAAIAKANSQVAKQNAEQAIEIGARDAMDIGTESRGLLGEQIAAQGASGLSLSSPSAVSGRKRAAELGYEDQVRRIEASRKQAANFLTQANVHDAEADAYGNQANFSLIEGFLNAGGSLLSNAPVTGGSGFGGSSRFGIPNPRRRPSPTMIVGLV